MFGPTPNATLRLNGVQFVHHICQFSSEKVINTMGPVLLSGMNKVIEEEKEVRLGMEGRIGRIAKGILLYSY